MFGFENKEKYRRTYEDDVREYENLSGYYTMYVKTLAGSAQLLKSIDDGVNKEFFRKPAEDNIIKIGDLLKKISAAKEKIVDDNHTEALELNKKYDELVRKINEINTEH